MSRLLPMALALTLPLAVGASTLPASVGSGPAAPSLPAAATEVEPAQQQRIPDSFTSTLEPEQVQLGQPFVWTIALRHEPALRYELQRTLALGTLEVRRREVSRGPGATTIRLELAIYDALGEVDLPALELVALADDGVGRFVVPGPRLQVITTATGEELEAFGGPEALALFTWVPLAASAAGVAAAAALGWGFVAWRRRRAGRPVEEVRAAPAERALAALDALEAEADRDRAFYFALSEIVRGFLEEETRLRAREMTTEELVEALVREEVPGLSLAQLGAWLQRGDLHRFARVPATAEQAAADLEKARALVRGVADARKPPVAGEAA